MFKSLVVCERRIMIVWTHPMAMADAGHISFGPHNMYLYVCMTASSYVSRYNTHQYHGEKKTLLKMCVIDDWTR